MTQEPRRPSFHRPAPGSGARAGPGPSARPLRTLGAAAAALLAAATPASTEPGASDGERRRGSVPAARGARSEGAALPPAAAAPLRPLPPAWEPCPSATDAAPAFVLRGASPLVRVRPGGADVAVTRDPSATVRIEIASPARASRAGARRPETVTRFRRGTDGAARAESVPRFDAVDVDDALPGVSLAWRVAPCGRARVDFHYAPGAEPANAPLRFRTGAEAPATTVDPSGRLIVGNGAGAIALSAPVAWEEAPQGPRPLAAAWEVVAAGAARFRVEGRDPARALVVDPVIESADLVGGSFLDAVHGVTFAADGDVIVTGSTSSLDLPATGGVQERNAGGVLQTDAFVARLDPATGALRSATYLGGREPDFGVAVAEAPDGALLLLGATDSVDFPLASPFQGTYGGGSSDLFVARLSARGDALLRASYLGGSGLEEGWGLAADAAGGAFVVGLTDSPDYPAAAPLQNGHAGGQDVFVTHFPGDGGAPPFSTLLGGSGDDQARAVALAPDGGLHVAGWTSSPDFPAAGDAPGARSGAGDAFLLRIAPGLDSVGWTRLIGGAGNEQARGVAVDRDGASWIAGWTNSADFPAARAFRAPPVLGATDAFVARVPAGGGPPDFASLLGGSAADEARALAIDGAGGVVVAGVTLSGDFPSIHAPPPGPRGSLDAFAARIDPVDLALSRAGAFGGAGGDDPQAMAPGPGTRVAVAGFTNHAGTARLPARTGALPPAGGGPRDGFVLVLRGGPAGLDVRRLRARGRSADGTRRVALVARLAEDDRGSAPAFEPATDAFSLRCGADVLAASTPDGADAGGGVWTGGDGVFRFRGGDATRAARARLDTPRRSLRLTARGVPAASLGAGGPVEVVLLLGEGRRSDVVER